MTDAEPIADLAQVRWSTRHHTPDNWAADVEPMGGWHVVGEVGADPDPYVRERFDLWAQNAHDGDGGDCSAWLADMVARKLTESDTTARWQRDRAVEKLNWNRARMRALESAASELLALFRDRNVCSPGPAYVVALDELAKALDGRPAMREEGP